MTRRRVTCRDVAAVGVIRALAEAGRAREVLYICHERSPAAVAGLLDGTVDLVVESPEETIARTITKRSWSARCQPPRGMKVG